MSEYTVLTSFKALGLQSYQSVAFIRLHLSFWYYNCNSDLKKHVTSLVVWLISSTNR